MKCILTVSGVFLLGCASLFAAPADSETITLDKSTDVPGATLPPGQVRFQVEDRLQDRAIVRITGQDGARHELVLSVPNDKLLPAAGGSVLFFAGGDVNKQTVQAWKCPNCAAPLEFVYPKDQAVAVTQATGKPVMAIDPSYDKLPANLSPDDMKVVTLWLLAPKQVTADGKGSGVEPTKLADLRSHESPVAPSAVTPSAPAAASAETAPAAVPAPTPQPESVQAKTTAPKMPHTAGSDYELAAIGLFLLLSSIVVFRDRQSRIEASLAENRG